MNIDDRNKWLIDNMEHTTKLLTDFCKRYEGEVEFEELYLEIIERLIEFLDSHELVKCGYFKSNITGKNTYVWQWILNQSMRIKNSKKIIEEPHYCFELLYLNDPDMSFISDYVYETAKEVLNPWELATFLMRVEWDCTFEEIAQVLGFTNRDTSRRYYERARSKLYATRDLRNKLKDYRDLYFIGGF